MLEPSPTSWEKSLLNIQKFYKQVFNLKAAAMIGLFTPKEQILQIRTPLPPVTPAKACPSTPLLLSNWQPLPQVLS